MSKLWSVVSKEYKEVVHKKSFVLGIVLVPIMMGIFMFGSAYLAKESETPTQSLVIVDLDESGFGSDIHAALTDLMNPDDENIFNVEPLETFVGLEDPNWKDRKSELDSAIKIGDLDAALIIFPNVIETESLIVITKTFAVKNFSRIERKIGPILANARLESSNISLGSGLTLDSILRMTRGVDLSVVSPSGESKNFQSVFIGMLVVTMVMFMILMTHGQSVMRSVIEEKASRIMEVVISSVSPFQLMFGKILAMCAAAFTQLGIWLVLGYAMSSYLDGGPAGPENVISLGAIFNPTVAGFFLVFLALGFILFSTVFALIGAIVTTDKEAQNLMSPIVIMLVAPVILLSPVASNPDAPWIVGMSFFPFLSPTMMLMRLSVADPQSFTLADPIVLQACIAVVTTALGAILMTWISARIFRVGILMYGKRATLPEILRWVRQK